MKIITYKCDLCKEDKKKDDLKAFYFKCDIIPQRYVLVPISPDNECDKHICKRCIEVIKGSSSLD